LQFRDKSREQNLEVDFLVVDVPTAYNVISGPLDKIKVVIASYLLQLQYEVDDGSVARLEGDQQSENTTWLASDL